MSGDHDHEDLGTDKAVQGGYAQNWAQYLLVNMLEEALTNLNLFRQ